MLAWAREGLLAAQRGGSVKAQPLWDAVAVAGHSRGGDVAYHQLQQFDWVKFAVLIDPVKQPKRAITPTEKQYKVIGLHHLLPLSVFYVSPTSTIILRCAVRHCAVICHAPQIIKAPARPGCASCMRRPVFS